MEIGKVSESILKRAVFRQIGQRRDEVLVRPGVGEDCSIIELADDEVVVLSTDPITGTTKNMGTLAVHVTANDIATSGAELIGVLLTILLPPNTYESELAKLIEEIEITSSELGIEVLGGHTEVTDVVNQPLISVTGVGKTKKDKMIKTAGTKPNQDIIMTKWAGLEGTSIIANEREEELLERFAKDFVERAKGLINYISVIEEAKIASDMGVSSMHDITEGGVYGALWEVAEASSVGIEVDISKIPIKQETIEICEFYNLNPYELISSGSLLIVLDKGNDLVAKLKEKGISAAVIGKTTTGQDKIATNGEYKRFLSPPKSDELYKL